MDAFDRVDALRADLDAMRPLDPADVARAMQRLRLEWTYHSNAIEGNSLTYGETVALLMHGVTAQGKPLKDHLDIRGHREALDYLEAFVQAREPLTLATIREMHKVLLGEPYEAWAETAEGLRVRRTITPGQFKTQPNHVLTQTGEVHHYARPDEVEPRMQALTDAIESAWPEIEAGAVHPVRFAAQVHHEVAAVHPFDDGNGRMARLLMNLVLMRAGYVPAVIRQERRPAYYGALASADAGDRAPFEQFVADELATTMELYARALRSEPDPDAFSRRVALLRREVETQTREQALTPERKAQLAQEFVLPLVNATTERVEQLRPLFGRVEHLVAVNDTSGAFRSGSVGLEALKAGDWVTFRPHWVLIGFRAQPSVQIHIVWEGQVGDRAFVLSTPLGQTGHSGQTYRYEGGLPGPDEVAPILEAAFNVVMDRIEAAAREAEA